VAPFVDVGSGDDDEVDRDAQIAEGLAKPDELGAAAFDLGLDARRSRSLSERPSPRAREPNRITLASGAAVARRRPASAIRSSPVIDSTTGRVTAGGESIDCETSRMFGVVVVMRFSVRLRIWVSAACSLMALLLPVATARASDAHLDREFGKGGIRYLPSSLRELGGAALLGDGRVLVGNEKELRALLPSGRFDPTFGNHGSARLKTGPGSVGEISGFAVDAEGRPVVVGSSGESTGYKSVVERLTPQGLPDPSFAGGRGFALTDFGIPSPEAGKPYSSYLEEVAFDPTGRLLVMGRAVIGTYPADTKNGPTIESVKEAFVARFEDSGQLDTSFATEGVFRDKGIERLVAGFEVDQSVHRDWSVGPGGKVALYAAGGEDESMLRLGVGGKPDPEFGTAGYAPYPSKTYEGPLIDQAERTITWGYLQGVPHRLPNGILIKRLTPNGSPDTSFGKGGAVTLRVPRLFDVDLALDEGGRVLIAAGLKGRGELSETKELALLRLQADGKLDPTFGHDGMIRIKFPHGHPQPSVYLQGLGVRGDQAVIAASYCGACQPVVAVVDLGGG
jgi:uncharacterized delta-60 repeat protein